MRNAYVGEWKGDSYRRGGKGRRGRGELEEEGGETKSLGTNHLETEGPIDHEEHEIGDLSDIDHGVEVVGAFDESESTGLA